MVFPFLMLFYICPSCWLVCIVSFLFEKKYENTLKKLIKEQKHELKPSTLTITNEYIQDKDENAEHKFFWKSINRIDVTGDFVFIYTPPNQATIIPKRLLQPEKEKDFIQTINGYLDKAKP